MQQFDLSRKVSTRALLLQEAHHPGTRDRGWVSKTMRVEPHRTPRIAAEGSSSDAKRISSDNASKQVKQKKPPQSIQTELVIPPKSENEWILGARVLTLFKLSSMDENVNSKATSWISHTNRESGRVGDDRGTNESIQTPVVFVHPFPGYNAQLLEYSSGYAARHNTLGEAPRWQRARKPVPKSASVSAPGQCALLSRNPFFFPRYFSLKDLRKETLIYAEFLQSGTAFAFFLYFRFRESLGILFSASDNRYASFPTFQRFSVAMGVSFAQCETGFL